MAKLRFTYSMIESDLMHYLDEEDVRVVLSRLPKEAWHGLRAVHFNDKSLGARRYGYANPREREICICALPPRVSLTAALVRGQTPELFGAERGKQWPQIAVRRFLLYDVLLHELGHLQILIANPKSSRRTHAREKLAQQFADEWRQVLWSSWIVHPDPVHNPPVLEECRIARLSFAEGACESVHVTELLPNFFRLLETPVSGTDEGNVFW